jgi:hypothetical protein
MPGTFRLRYVDNGTGVCLDDGRHIKQSNREDAEYLARIASDANGRAVEVVPEFDFPQLGPTGEGDAVYPPGTTREDYPHGTPRPIYWFDHRRPQYHVSYQLDRPACAYRCHYPHGSAPCDQATADEFIEWVKVTFPIEAGV